MISPLTFAGTTRGEEGGKRGIVTFLLPKEERPYQSSLVSHLKCGAKEKGEKKREESSLYSRVREGGRGEKGMAFNAIFSVIACEPDIKFGRETRKGGGRGDTGSTTMTGEKKGKEDAPTEEEKGQCSPWM